MPPDDIDLKVAYQQTIVNSLQSAVETLQNSEKLRDNTIKELAVKITACKEENLKLHQYNAKLIRANSKQYDRIKELEAVVDLQSCVIASYKEETDETS